jgi:hypothetical protein
MASTPGSYQAVTIFSLLLGAAILIFMVVMYTQNQPKLAIVDAAANVIRGPLSQLGIGNPAPGSSTTSHSVSVRDAIGREQFGLYLSQPNVLTWSSPNGVARTPLT